MQDVLKIDNHRKAGKPKNFLRFKPSSQHYIRYPSIYRFSQI